MAWMHRSRRHLDGTAKLEQDAGLRREQVLPELELRERAPLERRPAGAPPAGAQQRRAVVTRVVPACAASRRL